MQITLNISGKDQIFVAPFIKGRMLRKTLELSKNNKINDLDTATLDELVQYVVELFGNQFTIDEFYDGIESTEMIPFITGCMTGVVNKTSKATEALQDPNGSQA